MIFFITIWELLANYIVNRLIRFLRIRTAKQGQSPNTEQPQTKKKLKVKRKKTNGIHSIDKEKVSERVVSRQKQKV